MKRNRIFWLSLWFFLGLGAALNANQCVEMPSFIAASDSYAFVLSKPSDGKTEVYKVKKDSFELINTFDWVSDRVFIKEIYGDIFLARIQLYHDGNLAVSNHVCLEFYMNGKLMRAHSSLSIAGNSHSVLSSPANFEESYTPFKDVKGYIPLGRGEFAFQVVNVDGANLLFDMTTGARKE